MAANWFNFSVAAGQIQLDVGYMDVAQLVQVMNVKGKRPAVRPQLIARLVVPQSAFGLLQAQILDLARKMSVMGIQTTGFEPGQAPAE